MKEVSKDEFYKLIGDKDLCVGTVWTDSNNGETNWKFRNGDLFGITKIKFNPLCENTYFVEEKYLGSLK